MHLESIVVMTKYDDIAGRLAERRSEIGMSQSQLAIKAKIAPAQISRYESGVSKPSVVTIGKMANALGVTFGWLSAGDEPKFNDQFGGEPVDLEICLDKTVYDKLVADAKSVEVGIDEYISGLVMKN